MHDNFINLSDHFQHLPERRLIAIYFSVKLEHMSDQWVRVSEIGEYLYCRRAWWLRRMVGYRSVNLDQMQGGASYHQQHYKQVRSGERLQQIYRIALWIMGIATTLALLWWFLQIV